VSEPSPTPAENSLVLPTGSAIVGLSGYATYPQSLAFFDRRGKLAEALRRILGSESTVEIQESELRVGDEQLASVEPAVLYQQSTLIRDLQDEKAMIVETLNTVADVLEISAYEVCGVGAELILTAPDGIDPTEYLEGQFGVVAPESLGNVFDGSIQLQKHSFDVQHDGILFRLHFEGLSKDDVPDNPTLAANSTEYPDEFVFVNLKALGLPETDESGSPGSAGATVFDKVMGATARLASTLRWTDGD
jgi:hypothetical protein